MSGRRAICLAIAIAGTSTAEASPLDDPTTGRAVFTGATLPSVTSIVLDPAALAAPGPFGKPMLDELYLGGTLTLDQLGIDRRAIDVDTGATSPAGSISDAILQPGGDIAILVHPNPTFGLGAQLRLLPGQVFPEGHDELRYHTLGGYHRDLTASVALGLRLSSAIYVGASVTLDEALIRLRFARDTALEQGHGAGGVASSCGGSPCGVENPSATETYDIKVHEASPFSDGYVVNLGGMLRLGKDTWLAVAYHTPPGGATSVQNDFRGEVDVTRAPRDGGATLHGGATVYVSQPASVDVEFRTRARDDLDLHVGGRWLDSSRDSGYDVRLYGSVFPKSGIPEWIERPRGFHDTFALWGGVEQVDTGQAWRLGARLGLETSAIDDDQTTPITIAPHSVSLDVGVQRRVTPTFIVQVSYGLTLFPSLDVTSSAFDPRDRISCVDGGFDYATPACKAVRDGFAIPTADGDYSRIQHALRLGLRFELP